MNIYEVVFWSSPNHSEPYKDTIYLVRAPDYATAIAEIRTNVSSSDLGGRPSIPHAVYEIGKDLSVEPPGRLQILRGPYFASAYNHGWRAWYRKIEGSAYGMEWEERSNDAVPPAAKA